MKAADIDIPYLHEQFKHCAENVLDAWRSANMAFASPEPLIQSMFQLIDGFGQNQSDDCAPTDFIQYKPRLPNEQGLHWLSQLSELAKQLDLPEDAQKLQNLCLPLAVLLSRQDGEITHLAPVVNAIAFYANHSQAPEAMKQLHGLVNEIRQAISPLISENPANQEMFRPWRLLLLNQAIIATRTLSPTLMESTFDQIIEYLPDDAGSFFTDGMEQMDMIGYPTNVRKVMEKYYLAYAKPRVLH